VAGEGLPAQAATRVLDVTDAGYYAWRSRGPSARAVRHALVTETIRQVHLAFRGNYGYRRVHGELTVGRGLIVGHGTVELLMARAGLKGPPAPRNGAAGRPDTLATDLVDRRFTREGVDQLWVTDITEHPTREGKAVTRDTCSQCRFRTRG
jgi:transposase InsO family protein